MTKYAWRTPTGEKQFFDIKSEDTRTHCCNWYKSLDKPGELVLVYSLESTNVLGQTSAKWSDIYVNTTTSTGVKCSGAVGDWKAIALPGTYTKDGVLINKK